MVSAASQTHRSRALCWASTAMILGWGLTLAWPGNTLAVFPAYRLLAMRMSEETWAVMLIVIGLTRMVALMINGRMRRGSPIIRAVTSFAGAVIWSQFVASFLDYSLRVGSPSGDLTIYLVLLGQDVFSTARAGWDAVRQWR